MSEEENPWGLVRSDPIADIHAAMAEIKKIPAYRPTTYLKLFDYCDRHGVVETYGTGICPGCLQKTRKRPGEALA